MSELPLPHRGLVARTRSEGAISKQIIEDALSKQPVAHDAYLHSAVEHWTVDDVARWLEAEGFGEHLQAFGHNRIDGSVLLLLDEADLKESLGVSLVGDRKKLFHAIVLLRSRDGLASRFLTDHDQKILSRVPKVVFAVAYLAVVSFITAFVMAVVHDRVPDPTTYPPLPDIFLDNINHIDWAFEVVEYVILSLGTIFALVVLFHRHRMIIFWRFSCITGTVFLLRCLTMFVTSLSVPGAHLKCDVCVGASLEEKLAHAYLIISGLGLSVNGVRTCGDYMFSGHTVMLTLLNYFITEYTPSSWHGLHLLTLSLNMGGAFFVLAAHEHYSIDVFIAFFIGSRLFLYYHSLCASFGSKQLDPYHTRMRSYFPLFSYLEENTDGLVPNDYEWPWDFPLKLWRQYCTNRQRRAAQARSQAKPPDPAETSSQQKKKT
eukprot:TRINITY_DN9911_c0_g1_i1.p1 TRINITY_DN9911_c0_g1~~TRINITY_DN9911_c0_g1_i1.p1  ORF type:complete len:432 (-),score=155.32 TRINITY_DN9911_c0_g1_i1:233-1528(-)